MDGTSMVIEVLGRLIIEKDETIQKQQETIEHLNKKISLIEMYIDTYEKILGGGRHEIEHTSRDIDSK